MADRYDKLAGTISDSFGLGGEYLHGIRRDGNQLKLKDPQVGEHPLTDLIGGGKAPLVLQFRDNPTSNGTLFVVGGYEQTDTGLSLASGSPVSASTPYFNSKVGLGVSAPVGAPFTIQVQGTSVSQVDGTLTPVDTETVNVTGAGSYLTTKHWVDTPQFSIVEGAKSCTLDLYRVLVWDVGGKSLTINAISLSWTPDALNWSIQLQVGKVAADGTLTVIEDVTFANTDTPPRAKADVLGRFYRSDYSDTVDGSVGEGLFLFVDQTRIRSLNVGLSYV